MKWLHALASALATILRIVIHDGWASLVAILRSLVALQRAMSAATKRPGREGRVTEQQCVPVNEPAFKQPDPTIYSQGFLMSQGLAVTWDNPDIVLRRNGIEVPSYGLLPDTEYEIVARIWNNSTEAPVVGMPVRVSFVSFGIGTISHHIGSTSVNLGVKGGPNHPAFAGIAWRTPATAGHYCLQVQLDWFDDVNPNNNLGQENTTVGTAHSPAIFTFTLRNSTRERREYRFEVDTYTIPALSPCPPERSLRTDHNTPRGPSAPVRPVPRDHDRHSYPVPEGWLVRVEPTRLALDADEERTITAQMTPPPGFTGRTPFNVNAFVGDALVGGVTLIVQG